MASKTGFCLIVILIGGLSLAGYAVLQAQSPLITVRFANPQTHCGTQEYCLDVEFLSSIPDERIFGMNIRFFYDDDILELIDFRDFQGGYGPVAPYPPNISTSEPAGPALFNFEGPAEFVNGAMQLVSSGAPPILLSPDSWTKLYQICFMIDDQSAENVDTFCPPVVWDLEQDPTNGGFLAGDDGVVITVVDPNGDSAPADENVVQFNWEYIGDGSAPPYGQPIEIICSNVNCLLPVTWLSFAGKKTEVGHQLDWVTTGEVNLYGYRIQKKSTYLDWSDVGFVDATGAATAALTYYSFVDRQPSEGINYYRLESLDFDGRTDYSNIVSLREGTSGAGDWTIFPNPVTEGGRLMIRYSQKGDTPYLYVLTDLTGRVIRQHTLPVGGDSAIPIEGLAKGIYVLCIEAGGEYICNNIVIH